jgi:hypothetical protein
MAITAHGPSTALVVVDLQKGIVGLPTHFCRRRCGAIPPSSPWLVPELVDVQPSDLLVIGVTSFLV